MSARSKFLPALVLPALVLGAALAPSAASARSDRAPVQAPAQQQLLVGNFAAGQFAAAPQGRAADRETAANQLLIVTEAQYAAINSVPEEY